LSLVPKGGLANASEAHPALGNYRWHVVLMLWCISFLNYADRQAIFSVFPLLQKQLGLDLVQLGLLASSFAWVYGIGAPFAGIVVDRVRRKTAILGGLQVWSVICMVTGLCSNFRSLLILRAAEGLGETFYYPASMSMLSDYHGKQTRSKAIGIHQTSVYFGTIAGGFFAGLIGQHYGWRWSFYVFGGLGLVLSVVLRRSLREPVRGASERIAVQRHFPVRQALRIVWQTPTAVALMAAFLCANFVAVVLLSWMPKFVHDRFGLDLATSGLTATAFAQIPSFVGAIAGGWLADAWRRRTVGGRVLVQAIGVFCGAPFVALCGFSGSVRTLLFALAFWGFFKGLYDANIFASVFDAIRPEARGTATGFMNMIGWLGGGGTAPLIIGLVARTHGLGFSIALASVVYIASGFLLLTALAFISRDHAALYAEVAVA